MRRVDVREGGGREGGSVTKKELVFYVYLTSELGVAVLLLLLMSTSYFSSFLIRLRLKLPLFCCCGCALHARSSLSDS
jgi:hypothetical protein